jgi:hypothetical protein
MQNRRRAVLLLCLLAVLALAGVGCGGGDDEASDSTSVDELLDKTFSGDKKVESGKLDLTLRVDVQGGSASQLQGPIELKLGGPFQTQGAGKLPQFDMDASFQGGNQSLKAGLTSTGDKGFVNFNGTEYAVSDQVFKQFRAGYEEAQKKAKDNSKDSPTLATLGIDPRRWLTNPENAGGAKVGDADTIKVTGGVDVAKLLDDVNRALEQARSLGVEGAQGLLEKLTDEQKRQAAEAIKDLKVEIYTGKEDTTLRRMLVDLDVAAPESAGGNGESGTLALDFSLLELNEDQEIEAPSGAKPFDELLGQLGGLGLGGAGSGSSGSGSGSSGGGSGSSGGGASAEALKEYSDCVEAAGNDTAKVQKCAELLSP